jgi:hypothetical protein
MRGQSPREHKKGNTQKGDAALFEPSRRVNRESVERNVVCKPKSKTVHSVPRFRLSTAMDREGDVGNASTARNVGSIADVLYDL